MILSTICTGLCVFLFKCLFIIILMSPLSVSNFLSTVTFLFFIPSKEESGTCWIHKSICRSRATEHTRGIPFIHEHFLVKPRKHQVIPTYAVISGVTVFANTVNQFKSIFLSCLLSISTYCNCRVRPCTVLWLCSQYYRQSQVPGHVSFQSVILLSDSQCYPYVGCMSSCGVANGGGCSDRRWCGLSRWWPHQHQSLHGPLLAIHVQDCHFNHARSVFKLNARISIDCMP